MPASRNDGICSYLNAMAPLIVNETEEWLSAHQPKFNQHRLESVFSEIQESNWSGFFVDRSSRLKDDVSARPWNLFKVYVEHRTQQKWIWWPFHPPKSLLRDEEARIYWLCPCGDERWAEVPEFLTDRVQNLLLEHVDLYVKHLRYTVHPSNISYDYLERLRQSEIWDTTAFPADWSQHLYRQTVLLLDKRGILFTLIIHLILKLYILWRTWLLEVFFTSLGVLLTTLLKTQIPYSRLDLTQVTRFGITTYFQIFRWHQMHEPPTREYVRAAISASLGFHGCVLLYYACRRQEGMVALLCAVSIHLSPELLLLLALRLNLHGNIKIFLAWALAEYLARYNIFWKQSKDMPSNSDKVPEYGGNSAEGIKLTTPSLQDTNHDSPWNAGLKQGDSVPQSVTAESAGADQTSVQAVPRPSTQQEMSSPQAASQQATSQQATSQQATSQQATNQQPEIPPSLIAQQAVFSQQVESVGSSAGVQVATSTVQHAMKSQLPKSLHVFLVVIRGRTYKLAQLLIEQQITTNQFFQKLRSQYIVCRGSFRQTFSVWRYSHCDFYRFNKFEARLYEPQKQDFPPPVMVDYDYSPRPVDVVPPIGPHEFYKRFHACYDPQYQSWLPFRHRFCFHPSGHNRERLRCLPKRDLNIIEDSDQLEISGAYMRENNPLLRAF